MLPCSWRALPPLPPRRSRRLRRSRWRRWQLRSVSRCIRCYSASIHFHVIITEVGLQIPCSKIVKKYCSKRLRMNREIVFVIRAHLLIPNLFLSRDAHPPRYPRFPSVATPADVLWWRPPLLPAPASEDNQGLRMSDCVILGSNKARENKLNNTWV